MSDPTPAPSEKTVVVDNRCFGRLRTLTIVSLCLNGVIILFLLLACICHHHHKKHHGFGGKGGEGRGGQMRCDWGDRGQGQGFHRFRGQGWGRPNGFGPGGDRGGRGGFDGNRNGGGMGFRQGGFGGGKVPMGGGPGPQGGPGFQGGPGMGFGPRGMMGGNPPDPAKMTDGIVDMLSKKLTLTDDQKAKLKPIIQDQVTQFQKDMDAQRQAMQKKIEDAKAKIKPILNADQQKQLDALPMPGQKPPAPVDQGK